MADARSFRCRRCDYRTEKWLGRCPGCDAWDALLPCEDGARPAASSRVPARTQAFPAIEAADTRRTRTGVAELDRVLGGGLVPGAVVLLAGAPGIGKSTLLLQAASAVAETGRRVLYVSGEESPAQLRSRGARLGIASRDLLVAAETTVEAILDAARLAPPCLLAVDSIQAVRSEESGAVPGSVTQVRESAARFVEFAKATGTPVVLVGHVTKDGNVAGPRALEHVVDAVVQFEGDRHHEHRILRALKNRFGPAAEIGVFRMAEAGLVEVADPSERFLARRSADAPGSAVLAAIAGTRPLLVEIQALVGESIQGSPRRTVLGVDPGRVALVLAVLERRAGLQLANRDVFVNVTGGVSLSEPAADLAVAAAVSSSVRRRPLPPRAVVAGEVGLTGEIRSVSRVDARIREAERLGFRTAVVPDGGSVPERADSLHVSAVRNLREAFARLWDPSGR